MKKLVIPTTNVKNVFACVVIALLVAVGNGGAACCFIFLTPLLLVPIYAVYRNSWRIIQANAKSSDSKVD
ncbi:hypothetical protein HNY73_005961 [Argiope bruennichi]|uniref:Uncharacterized protein n=1 Tax=Argiope bruennichi TaxID=94029 RepID=A0A8T0FN72_ARGBR|nr:hypothetical protein HNY73_005961 [Argiope bruennichi]